MSVYFFRTVWGFSDKPEDIFAITDEQLIDLAIKEKYPGEYEKETWLLEVRRERAGKIENKTNSSIKIYAGGSLGECLYPLALSIIHPNVYFYSIDGADCTNEECLSLIKDGIILFRDTIFEGELIFKQIYNELNSNFDYLNQDCILNKYIAEINNESFIEGPE
jgi:hypothetical protein